MIFNWYFGFSKKKTSRTKVFLKAGVGKITINNIEIVNFFKRKNLINYIYMPLNIINFYKLDILIKTEGGGEVSKAISAMYALAKALINYNYIYKKNLKKNNMLVTDNRIVERKKYGYLKARKQKQYSKR
ncbi:30S ribosomal protein S9 [Candidatus Vidania fulgoroideorum]